MGKQFFSYPVYVQEVAAFTILDIYLSLGFIGFRMLFKIKWNWKVKYKVVVSWLHNCYFSNMYMRWIILSCLIFLAFLVSAQVTYIDQLHDSLKPQIVGLDTVPSPKKNLAGKPRIKIFPDNIAQGRAFFTTYTSDDGLPMDVINFGKSTLYDSKGNLWVATQGGGVSKYDGKSFTSYTIKQGLAHNKVYSIAEDNSGNLWFGTYGGGVSKYDGRCFTTINTEQGLAGNIVLSICIDQSENIWFGTYGGGVSKYDGESFMTYTTDQGLLDNKVYAITEDKSGNIWFGTYMGVSKYNGKSFTTYTTNDGLIDGKVFSITEDQSGDMWFGTGRAGVSKYDGKSFTNYTTEDGLAYNKIHNIVEDRSGNMWFATHGGGVSVYDGKSFVTYATEQGLTNNHVFNIVEDKSGSLWFGTYQGLSEYKGKSIITYTTEQGLTNNAIASIVEDKAGCLWFGTHGGGISRYDKKSITTYTTDQGLVNNYILCSVEDQSGNLWFGTYKGLSKYDGNSFTTYNIEQGLASNGVLSIAEDRLGNLWFGTNGGGVSKYDGTSFTSYTIKQDLANNVVYTIVEDRSGNLWFGTNGGVSKYDGNSFTTYNIEQGLASNGVLSIAEDQSGNLWFGTNGGGMSKYDGEFFITYTAEQGLPSNDIYALRFDDQNRLIIGTNFGLAVVTPKAGALSINEEDLKQLEVYNQFTGYGIRDINSGSNNGAILIDNKGLLWVGHGKNGVTRVDLDAVNKNEDEPNVVINNVRIKGENICFYSLKPNEKLSNQDPAIQDSLAIRDSLILSQQEILTYGKELKAEERDALKQRFLGITFDDITPFYALPENLVLPYEHNAITFEYSAIETGRNFLINYQYKLKGFEDDWSAIGKKTEVNYNNLREGKYTFLLRAQSSWGVWSEPIEFSFEVLPPWYRSIWAYICYIILGFIFVSGVVQLQTKRLKEQRKVLEKKVEFATNEVVKEKREAERQRDEAEELKKLAEEQRSLVELKNLEIERAHKQLAVHHKEIQDSIKYAKRIQRAIMPSIASLAEALKDGFVIYEPKGVVAGDFFWMEQQEDVVYFAAADCTGHGVPGALVSVVCSNALSKSLLEEGIKDTGKLLDKAREIVIERLAKSGDKVKDGMDISLCALNMKTKELKWSGANNPLWITRSIEGSKFELYSDHSEALLTGVQINENELIEIKPDRQPIGHYSKPTTFITHTIQLSEGDTIYTFTDGYQDQFGGPKGKKFRAKQFKELLAKNHNKSMNEIHKLLVEKFREWQGSQEQVDDVCIIGVRV